jgi:glycosyltransferase involved in cell wall biosynthesis
MSSPVVSVIIPTRSRWHLLSRHALPSALAQEGVDFEVVVVDDASDDETAARLDELRDDRVGVVRHPVRRRLPAARNSGVEVARGEWLAFLDDDDLWSPDKLRSQLDVAAATGAEWVYARAIVVDTDLRPLDVHPFPEPEELPQLLLGGNHVPGGGSNVVVRSATFRQAGGFDEELRYFEDWDLWLRLVQETLPAACPDVLVAHVEHGANMLFRDRADVLADFERLRAKHRDVTRSERLAVAEWVAHEHMRSGRHLRAAALYGRAAIAFRSAGNLVPAVGALFGSRGLAAASRLLEAVTGRTHLEEAAIALPPAAPDWLSRFEQGSSVPGSQVRAASTP